MTAREDAERLHAYLVGPDHCASQQKNKHPCDGCDVIQELFKIRDGLAREAAFLDASGIYGAQAAEMVADAREQERAACEWAVFAVDICNADNDQVHKRCINAIAKRKAT